MPKPHRRVLSGKETERRTNVSRIQRWRKIKEGSFPAPIEIGPNQIGWFEAEIEEWLASRPRRTYGGTQPDQEVAEAEVAARMDLDALEDAHDHDEADRARLVEALEGMG